MMCLWRGLKLRDPKEKLAQRKKLQQPNSCPRASNLQELNKRKATSTSSRPWEEKQKGAGIFCSDQVHWAMQRQQMLHLGW